MVFIPHYSLTIPFIQSIIKNIALLITFRYFLLSINGIYSHIFP
ncbi:protein of unknown function [Streptococcus thermophilus]|nr:protein of unknown function [Streptococcus thermophilus]CAD0132364.1 protein of unknown function [Streptococcus thermophilus]